MGKIKVLIKFFSINENEIKKLKLEFDNLNKIYSKSLNLESKNSLFLEDLFMLLQILKK